MKELHLFYEDLYSNKDYNDILEKEQTPFILNTEIPKLHDNLKNECKGLLKCIECFNTIQTFNKTLFKMGVVSSKFCSFCEEEEESLEHFFFNCKLFWESVRQLLKYSKYKGEKRREN